MGTDMPPGLMITVSPQYLALGRRDSNGALGTGASSLPDGAGTLGPGLALVSPRLQDLQHKTLERHLLSSPAQTPTWARVKELALGLWLPGTPESKPGTF